MCTHRLDGYLFAITYSYTLSIIIQHPVEILEKCTHTHTLMYTDYSRSNKRITKHFENQVTLPQVAHCILLIYFGYSWNGAISAGLLLWQIVRISKNHYNLWRWLIELAPIHLPLFPPRSGNIRTAHRCLQGDFSNSHRYIKSMDISADVCSIHNRSSLHRHVAGSAPASSHLSILRRSIPAAFCALAHPSENRQPIHSAVASHGSNHRPLLGRHCMEAVSSPWKTSICTKGSERSIQLKNKVTTMWNVE